MFRPSDYEPPRLHPTFVTKPTPVLQKVAQTAPFDEYRKSHTVESPRSDPVVIPVTRDTKFDPSHPDADWAGLVDIKNNQRRHTNTHKSQQCNIVHSDRGIVGADEIQAWPHLRRAGGNNTREEPLIGGIEADDQYKTSYRRMANHEETDLSQMVLNKRTLPKKILCDPTVEHRRQHNVENTQRSLNQTTTSAEDVYGYRPAGLGKSFIANIGSSLVNKVETIPASSAPKMYSKDLLVENYNTAPGYTGRRTIN